MQVHFEQEIVFTTARSGGKGGQHVNKVSSAIRATHVPTGISVVSMDSRSQHQNKKLATERLLLKLNEAQLNLLKQQFQSQWTNQLAVERGNPIRTFEGSDFKKLKVEKKFKAVRQQLKNELKNEKYR